MALLGPDGQPASAPRPPSQTPEEPPAPLRVTTAFLAYQLPNGHWIATGDLDAAIVPSRKPGFDDIIGGAANVQAEVIARRTADMAAATTIQTQMAVAQQMQGQTMSPEEQAAVAAAQSRAAGR